MRYTPPSSFSEARDDIRAAASSASDAAQDFGSKAARAARDAYANGRSAAADFADDARESVSEGYETARKAAADQWSQATEWITENPLRAAGYAAIGGVLIGLWFARGAFRRS